MVLWSVGDELPTLPECWRPVNFPSSQSFNQSIIGEHFSADHSTGPDGYTQLLSQSRVMNVLYSPLWRCSRCLVHETFSKPGIGLELSKSLGNAFRATASPSRFRGSQQALQTSQPARTFRSWGSVNARRPLNDGKLRNVPPLPSTPNAPFEAGVTLPDHREPLSRTDISLIFRSSALNGQQGLRLLQVLQGRRINGTLDLPLPPDLARLAARDNRLVSEGLKYLRYKYPVDEDAAILRRIQAEEAAKAQIEQSQGKGRFQPQSGEFGVRRGENNSIFGESVLDKWREENEKKARLEEEEDNRMIDQLDNKLKREGKSGGLIRVEDQDLSLGKPVTLEGLRWFVNESPC